MYNLMTCEGFGTGVLGPCAIAWLCLGVLFLLTLILRRQSDDGFLSGTPFNFIFSFLGIMVFIVIITVSGSVRWSLLGGFIGILAGGFGIGLITGGDY